MTPLLEASGIAIDGRLDPTDLQLAAGEMVALIGPNGSGKTSLLRSLAGADAGRGSVRVDGEDLWSAPPARRARLVGFLPASRDIAWPIAVRDVIGLGLTSPEPARVQQLIAALELESLAERPVNRLSTGERSRVLLARALAPRPRLLLLDEPLSNLDPYWVLRILALIRAAVAEEHCSAIVSLHDIDRVEAFDRALLMDRARIVADAAPDQVLTSALLAQAFRIERSGDVWSIRQADRQSSR